MRCPKCNREVPKGSLYCPGCMHEIKWVADYESVETLMAKKQILGEEEPDVELPELHARKSFPKIRWYAGIAAVSLLVICGCMHFVISGHKAERYYRSACIALEKEDYVHALAMAKAAFNLMPDEPDIMLVYCRALMGGSDAYSEGIVRTLEEYLERYEGNEDLYRILLEQYYMKHQKVKISRLIEQMPSEIRSAFPDYYVDTPILSVPGGKYSTQVEVEILNAAEETYYTVDGTVPTMRTNHYSGPIRLRNGTTDLKVVSFNEKGFSSKIAEEKYVVYAGVPDAPSVEPESGDYYQETYITVEVPDGCTCYYGFDRDCPQEMVLYTAPVPMPAGEHIFYAVLKGTSEEYSETTAKVYELTYD